MEWKYRGYEKIEEDSQRWGIDERGFRQIRKATWVILEKIHGAHFCILTDGREVTFAKRREILEDEEDFFGHRALASALASSAREVAILVKAAYPKASSLAIHGEIFGGAYPHPDVPPIAGVEAVQTGLWYSPSIHFCAYDIALPTDDGPSFLPYKEVLPWLEKAGFLAAQPLHLGKYEDALTWALDFPTSWPARLGLPPLKPSHPAEGIVAKPWDAVDFKDAKGRPFRPILKRKHPDFAEDARFHQAKAWKLNPKGEARPPKERVEDAILALATPQRLAAALSKVGRVAPHQKAKVAKLKDELKNDILSEIQAQDPTAWKSLSDSERSSCLLSLEDACQILLHQIS